MKIAIIGANGFVGTRLLEMLHLGSSGHLPVPIVRRPSGLAPVCRFAVDWRIGDALELKSLTKALEGCDAVIHSAIGDPRQIERMPAILCEAASNAGIRRVVYLSSASVHGQAPAHGTTEESPLHTGQVMEYNNAKVRAEISFFRQCSKRDLEGFALRPGVVYGPRSRWIADLAKDLRGGQAWLHGDGSAVLNGIYVDNLCEAALRCLSTEPSTAGAYLLGDPAPMTWRGFTLAVASGVGVSEEHIHSVQKLPTYRRELRQRIRDAAAGSFAQTLLPFFPGSLKQGVKRLLESPPARTEAWSLPSPPAPRFTQELVLLQQCQWRLPHDKATRLLGYAPRVDSTEGIRRSLAWLAFAEGRPC